MTIDWRRKAMEGVTVVKHPLVQHKLTLIRDKRRSTKSFRDLLKEIGMLLCYEVTRDLPMSEVEIETPLARMRSPCIAGKKLVDRKSTRLNSSHMSISYAVFCLKKKKNRED